MATSRRFPDDALDPQMASIKLPPHSLEAEQSLIGGILLDNSAWSVSLISSMRQTFIVMIIAASSVRSQN